jgi:hypothetical protein
MADHSLINFDDHKVTAMCPHRCAFRHMTKAVFIFRNENSSLTPNILTIVIPDKRRQAR